MVLSAGTREHGIPARAIVTSALRILWTCRAALADMAAPFAMALAWWMTSLAAPPEQRGPGTTLAVAATLWLALPLVANIHRMVQAGGPQAVPSSALVRLGKAEVLVAAGVVLTVGPVAFALALLLIAGITGSAIGLLIALPEVVLLVAASLRLFPAIAAGALGLWPPWRLAWGLSAVHFWHVARTVALAVGLVGLTGYGLAAGLGMAEAWVATPEPGRTTPPLAGVLVVAVLKAAAATISIMFLSLVSAALFATLQEAPAAPGEA